MPRRRSCAAASSAARRHVRKDQLGRAQAVRVARRRGTSGPGSGRSRPAECGPPAMPERSASMTIGFMTGQSHTRARWRTPVRPAPTNHDVGVVLAAQAGERRPLRRGQGGNPRGLPVSSLHRSAAILLYFPRGPEMTVRGDPHWGSLGAVASPRFVMATSGPGARSAPRDLNTSRAAESAAPAGKSCTLRWSGSLSSVFVAIGLACTGGRYGRAAGAASLPVLDGDGSRPGPAVGRHRRARRARHPHDPRDLARRRGAGHRLRSRAGPLLPDGSGAPPGGRRAGRAGRRRGPAAGSRGAAPPVPRRGAARRWRCCRRATGRCSRPTPPASTAASRRSAPARSST